jgi:UTP:GlnB (protein PII) uridylyltransferase
LRFPGHRIKDEPAHPYDPDDFGRCLGLLEAVPELREHVPKMAEHGKVWTAYVAHWAEMEALYQEEFPLGRAPKLAALMKLLQESA